MPRLFFPFAWGTPSTDTVIVPPAPPPFWVKNAPGVVSWRADGAPQLPRFQHIYPQDTNILWTKKEPV